MTGKQVWYPRKSRATESEDKERGRGSSPSKQQAQLSSRPTRALETGKAATEDQRDVVKTDWGTDRAYSTIESHGDSSILEYSSISSVTGTAVSSQDFNGWLDRELLSPTKRPVHTPGDGLRSNLVSRLESRGSQRRRVPGYEFQHFLEAHSHIEHYRAHYSYTILSSTPSEAGSETVDQGNQTLFKLEVKSLYRGDPYLRELASRLGVGDSIRDPQLLTPPKHTPPSIVKKHGNKTDLAIDLSSKQCSDENEDDLSTPETAWGTTSTRTRPPSQATPLELPRIPEAPVIPQRSRHKSTSNISISKYLRVTSQGEEGTESDHTLPHVPTTNTLSSASSHDHLPLNTVDSSPADQPVRQQEQPVLQEHQPVFHQNQSVVHQDKPRLFSLDKAQKEQLLSHKAHSLGLTSRHWAAPPTSKQINNYISRYSRPPTRQKERSGSASKHTRSPTRQQERSGSPEKQARLSTRQQERSGSSDKHTRPPTRQQKRSDDQLCKSSHQESPNKPRPHSTLHKRAKLDRLKSIYDKSSSHTSRTRPPTRLHRPRTQGAAEVDSLDDSSYWNELPGQSSYKQLQSNNSARLGIDVRYTRPVSTVTSTKKQTRRKTDWRNNESIAPGASPQQIAEHLSRLKRKFDGVLKIHKKEIPSANINS